ncbi:MAG TPA: nicotinate (nicotinamide) nucleotide adenylyltransferase [Treponema sp.]|nr:nicotinate (nicotinamide) nucleotide adenylyltransferase [Treponema sp.]
MRLAILGGSFNPVHVGHLFLAEEALASLDYDRIVMIPACRSPFKLAAAGMESTGIDRLEMLAASIAGDPRLTVDDCELKREGVSYTIDTLKDIIGRYMPAGKPGLIIGDDLAANFLDWHKSTEILDLADIIIARRVHTDGFSCSFPYQRITNEIINISSEMVRNRIAEKKAWHYMIPAEARAIIEDRGLYGSAAEDSGGSFRGDTAERDQGRKNLIFSVEQTARREMSLNRFIHSRNTALLAWDLCRRFGIDPELGYLAGIAHDLGKPLKEQTLLALAKKDGGGLSKLERKKPALLHGRAAALLLRERFGVDNADVLEAVAMHTGGGANMCPLAKIVYIADKMEVSREKADPALRAMCYTENDLDRVFFAVFDDAVSWLRSRKIDLSEETLRLLEKREGKIFEKDKN